MKGFAMLGIGKTGWIEKDKPVCGPMDAICRPLALAPCTSDVHTVWAGAIGDRHNLILGHEGVGEVIEVGSHVKDFKKGDKVLIPAITPDWNSVEAQAGFAQHSGGMLSGWKFSNIKDGVFGEFFHVNDADGNLALLPDGMDLGTACMLSDMIPTGVLAAEMADIQFGDKVCIIGIGPVGLGALAATAIRGASEIFAVGSRPNCKLNLHFSLAGNADIFNQRRNDCTERLEKLNNQISVLRQAERNKQAGKKTAAIAKHALSETTTPREIVETLIDKVLVYPGKRIEIQWEIADFTQLEPSRSMREKEISSCFSLR